jgi:hypothetical protein
VAGQGALTAMRAVAEIKAAITRLTLEDRTEVARGLHEWEEGAWDKQRQRDQRVAFARVGHGRRVPLIMARSLSVSSREGFWPERARKKAGRWAVSSLSARMWSGMRPAPTAA